MRHILSFVFSFALGFAVAYLAGCSPVSEPAVEPSGSASPGPNTDPSKGAPTSGATPPGTSSEPPASSNPPAPGARPTMYVDGSALRDRCGDKVVLRGANAGIAFPSDPQASKLPELAKTGANAVRLTFRMAFNNSSPAEVDAALTAATQSGMVGIPAVWDATGDFSKLESCVDFWLKPAMLSVLKKHEGQMILNIANEAGDGSVTNTQFRNAYAAAITKLRAAGLRMPILIDAANWGRNESYIFDNAAFLLKNDKDLLFGWHPYDPNQPVTRYDNAFGNAAKQGIALVVGEFAQLEFPDRPTTTIDYTAIMSKASAANVGWLWWWWYGDDAHSLTTDGIYGHWANKGAEVCVTSPYGIAKTSIRTKSMTTGACQ